MRKLTPTDYALIAIAVGVWLIWLFGLDVT